MIARLLPTTRARIVALLALVLTLRLPSFFKLLMDIDEAEYASIVCRMLDGGLPYRDGVTIKLPGILYVYYGAFKLFGRYNMHAVHLVCALCAFATALVCRGIATRLAGEAAGWWAAVFYAVFSVGYYAKMQAANTEMFAVLPAALAVLFYLDARRSARLSLFVVSGMCGGLAVVFKQPVALVSVALATAGLVHGLSRQGRLGLELVRGLLIALGGALVLALMALFLYSRGILGDTIFWTWTYIWRHYFPSVQDSLLMRLLSDPVPLALAMSPIVVLAALARGAELSPIRWWLLGMVAAAFVGGRVFGHYFLLAVPPTCVLAAVAASRLDGSDGQRRLRRAAVALTVALAVGQLIGASLFEGATDSLWSPKPNYLAATEHLEAVTQPNEPVFVWGWFPALYVAGQRCPSTRFVYAHHLAGRAPTAAGKRGHSVPEAWQELLHDLEQAPPAYVLDISHGEYGFQYAAIERYPMLWDFVSRSYVLETEIAGVRFYRRRDRPAIP